METPRAITPGMTSARVTRLLAAIAVALTALAVLASAAFATPRFGSGPVVGRNADGRLEVFTSDYDGDILHMYQLTAGGSWSGWSELPFSANFGLARPGVMNNHDGRLELFAQSGSRMYHNYQVTPNGSWSGWLDFGGGFANMLWTQPIATWGTDGHLELFAVGANGHLLRRHQTAPTGGTWSGWEDLGGTFDPSAIPAPFLTYDGKQVVFMLDKNGVVQYRMQTSRLGPWGGWTSLGGGPITGGFLNGQNWGVAVARNQNGRLEVFATGRDHQLYHRWQADKDGGWVSGWASLGGFIGMPVAARHPDGRLEVMARTTPSPQGSTLGTSIRHITQTTAGGGWSAWSYLGGAGPGTYQTPSIATNADARFEVFIQEYQGEFMWHSWQIAPGGSSSWSNFTPLVAG